MSWQAARFTTVFNAHYPGLVRFLRALSGDEELARDTTQEAFLRLYRTGPGVMSVEAARFWVLRTGRNLILNELNRRRRWNRLTSLFGASVEISQPGADTSYLRQEESGLQSALLRNLSEDQRAALLLREMEGMSYREIAATLGVSESKVKVNIHRARMKLKITWKELKDGGGRAGAEVDHGL
jgi:RNA polymerase sigma factor (sigma-70 family)